MYELKQFLFRSFFGTGRIYDFSMCICGTHMIFGETFMYMAQFKSYDVDYFNVI